MPSALKVFLALALSAIFIVLNLLINEGVVNSLGTTIFFAVIASAATLGTHWLTAMGLGLKVNPKMVFGCFFTPLLLAHFAMAILLMPLKEDFDASAKNGVLLASEYAPAKMSFGGRLDSVVMARDEVLRRCGFVGVGRWMARDGYGSSREMAYLFYAPWRLKSCYALAQQLK